MRKKNSGWSLLELLVVIVMLAFVGAVLFPALARTGSNSHSLQCLNNLRQLMAAISMYTHENHDLLPPNPDNGTTVPGYNWCPGIAAIGGSEEFNSDILKDPTRSLLSPYIQNEVTLFRCPAEPRIGTSTAPSTLGQKVRAARTVSMNGAVGTDPYSAKGQLAVNGAWLDGQHNNTRNGPWFTYAKTTDIVLPSPASLYVLLDENPFSINDAYFAFSMVGSQFIDSPGIYHNFGGSFAFADGSAQIHKWQDARTANAGGAISAPGDPDILWIQQRTSVHK